MKKASAKIRRKVKTRLCRELNSMEHEKEYDFKKPRTGLSDPKKPKRF